MGLTDRRKTAKNLADSRKNWKILTELMQTDCEQELITRSPWVTSICTMYFCHGVFINQFFCYFDFVANLEYLVSPNQSAKSTDLKMVFFFTF